MCDGGGDRMMVNFSGMSPWEVGSEITSCVSEEAGYIDLHNWSDLVDLEESDSEDGGRDFALVFRDLWEGRIFRLVFHGVACLDLTESRPSVPEDAGVFHAFDYLGDGKFEFEAERASGRLTASAVSLLLEPRS